MQVKVKFFASAREITGAREETVEIEDFSRVLDLLKLLAKKHGDKLKTYLFDPKTGDPRPYLQFLIDSKPVHAMDGFGTLLAKDCTFIIMPPVTGG